MNKILILILVLFSSTLVFASCPHELNTETLHKNNHIEILKFKSLNLSRPISLSDFTNISDAYYKVTNLFDKTAPIPISLVLTTAADLIKVYPGLKMFYGGYFDGALNNACKKNIVFIDMTLPQWTKNKLYTFTHELFHAYHFQICGINCNTLYWFEEALADYVASRLVSPLLINSTNSFLIHEKPAALFANRSDYNSNPMHYGYGYLFVDLMMNKLKDGTTLSDVIQSNVTSENDLENYFEAPNLSSLGLQNQSSFNKLYYEFVFNLLNSGSNLFSREGIFFGSTSGRKGILPSGKSFALFERSALWWHDMDDIKLQVTLSKNLPIFYVVYLGQKKTAAPFCNGLSSTLFLNEINLFKLIRSCEGDIQSIKTLIVNTTDEDVEYTVLN